MVDAKNVKVVDAAYKKAIAAYLIQRAQQDRFLLEAMAKEGKSLDGVLAYVKSEARKQQREGVAVIPDEEVYQWAVHYVIEDSLDCEPKEGLTIETAAKTKKTAAKTKKSVEKATESGAEPVEKPRKTLKAQVDDQLTFDFGGLE